MPPTAMLQKPTFRSCFRVEAVETEGVVVVTETDYRLLKGHVERLLPVLTGDFTAEEIMERFRGEIPAEELRHTLEELEKRGYLVESTQADASPEAVYWDSLRVDPARAGERLRDACVGVAAFGDVAAEPMTAALEALGMHVGPGGDLDVVLADDYLHDGLAAFNREAVRAGRPFLLVKPVGTIPWLGPLVVPGRTACWACLARRLELNRPAETFLRQRRAASVPAAGLPSTVQTALHLAATEVAKWVVQGCSEALENTLITFDTRSLLTRAHPVVRRPQCTSCGDPDYLRNRARHPLKPVRRAKRFTDDGGHRTVPPGVTLRTYEHHVSPITGVVHRLERLSDAENGLVHSYRAGHAIASPFDGFGLIRKNLRDVSGGKGRTDLQARVSALCEALERHSGIYQGDEPAQVATYRELGEEAIHPNACMGFSERQYRNRERLNARGVRLAQWIPEPFDDEREIEWTPVWSLSCETLKYLPTAYCFFGYPPERSTFCRADSNGNAAGNTIEEAVLQGFMEVVERDAVAIWWYNRLSRPGVDLEAFEEPYFDDLRATYRTIGRELWVLDLTTELNVPSFAALSRRTDAAREYVIVGFGAHFDARLAIQRALTEMNQVLPAALQAEVDAARAPIHLPPDLRNASATSASRRAPIHLDEFARRWWREATLDGHPYLAPRPDRTPRVPSDYPRRWNDDLLDDVRACQAIVENAGMELLVLDQTRPDVGLPVVKVIVPGLRHYWPRFGAGRLYTVPVQRKWLKEPRVEEQMNPFSFVF